MAGVGDWSLGGAFGGLCTIFYLERVSRFLRACSEPEVVSFVAPVELGGEAVAVKGQQES